MDNLKTGVPQDILQQKKGRIEEQEHALQVVTAGHIAKEVWKQRTTCQKNYGANN